MDPYAGRSRKGPPNVWRYIAHAFSQMLAVASAQAGIDPERWKTGQEQAGSKGSVCPVKEFHNPMSPKKMRVYPKERGLFSHRGTLTLITDPYTRQGTVIV